MVTRCSACRPLRRTDVSRQIRHHGSFGYTRTLRKGRFLFTDARHSTHSILLYLPGIDEAKRWAASTTHPYINTSAAVIPYARATPSNSISHNSNEPRSEIVSRSEIIENTWNVLLEQYLPPILRKKNVVNGQIPFAQPAPIANLEQFVSRVHEERDLDLFSGLSLRDKRWDASLWLARALIENAKMVRDPRRLDVEFPMFPKDNSTRLHDITSIPVTLELQGFDHLQTPYNLEQISSPHPQSVLRTHPPTIGAIWRGLGNMVLHAADQNARESIETMEHVLQIVSLLYQNGHLSQQAFTVVGNSDPSAPQRPEWVRVWVSQMSQTMGKIARSTTRHLDNIIMNSLPSEAGGKTQDLLAMSANYSLNDHTAWLEFILWCCVDGQWLHEGQLLAQELQSRSSGAADSIIIHHEHEASASAIQPRRNVCHVPKISDHVVFALVDGLLTSLNAKDGQSQHSLFTAMDDITNLQRLLARSQMSLGVSTWDAVINRVASLSPFSVEESPSLMVNTLLLAAKYRSETDTSNALFSLDERGQLASYVFDGTGSTIGLYHRTLQSTVRIGDIGGALQILKDLQKLTDANKKESLADFFKELSSTEEYESVDGEDSTVQDSSRDSLPDCNQNAEIMDFTLEMDAYTRWCRLNSHLPRQNSRQGTRSDKDENTNFDVGRRENSIPEDQGSNKERPAVCGARRLHDTQYAPDKNVELQGRQHCNAQSAALAEYRDLRNEWEDSVDNVANDDLVQDERQQTDQAINLEVEYIKDPLCEGSVPPIQRIEFPGYHPFVPKQTLADLLDLITDSKAFEIGNWMVLADEIDGPMIPIRAHSDRILAPALIRFASATHNEKLLSQLIQAQSSKTSAETLLALSCVRIQDGNFKGAEEVLKHIAKYSFHVWTMRDSARLISSLLMQIVNPEHEVSAEAGVTLQRFLRGDGGYRLVVDHIQLEMVAGVLSSVDETLKSLCADIPVSRATYNVDIPRDSFNIILKGVAQAFGSGTAKRLWEVWCTGLDRRTLPRTPNSLEDTDESISYFVGKVKPDVSTLRIIIRAALEEYFQFDGRVIEGRSIGDGIFSEAIEREIDTQLPKNEGLTIKEERLDMHTCHKVLDWAIAILPSFGVEHEDVDFELRGYATRHRQGHRSIVPSAYRSRTLAIWRAFDGPRKYQAVQQEQKLRRFASQDAQEALVIKCSAAERAFVHYLAQDYSLQTKSVSAGEEHTIVVTRREDRAPAVPQLTLDDASRIVVRR